MNLIRNLKAPVLKVDSDIDEILRPNRYLLTVVGVWPLDSNASYSATIFSLFRIILTTILCVFTIITQSITMYFYWGDVNVLSEVGCTLVPILLVSFKLLYVVFRHNNYNIAYKLIRKFWVLARNQEERNNIVELTNHARFCTLFYIYMAMFNIPMNLFSSILITLYSYAIANGTDYYHKLPFFIDYGIDTQTSPNYEILFVIQSFVLIFATAGTIGLDGTMMSIIMHIAAQFRVINLRLKVIGRRMTSDAELKNKQGNNLKVEIDLCLAHHQRILSVFQYVDDLVGPVILYQLLLTGLEICFAGWSLVQFDSDMMNTVMLIVLQMAMWMQLVFWCWSGEAILRESSDVGNVVYYDIPWFTLPSSVRRNLMLIVCRSQKRCQVTAVGWQVMGMKKLTEVFNTVLSYMALLRSITAK